MFMAITALNLKKIPYTCDMEMNLSNFYNV